MSYGKDFFRRIKKAGYTPRVGQKKLWEIMQSARKSVYLSVVPTGYGKSDMAAGSYVIKRDMTDEADRLLIIVVTDIQRSQYVEDFSEYEVKFGVDFLKFKDVRSGVWRVARDVSCIASDYRLCMENRCEVFVATIQTVLSDQAFFLELMSKGRWMVVFDEMHKLSVDENAKWGAAGRKVWGAVNLGLTATPIRTDGAQTLFGDIEPDVRVTYSQAYKEQAIRGVVAHIEHYTVSVLDENGCETEITTKDLLGASSFDNYEKKKDLRYNSNYLSGILSNAVACLRSKNLAQPYQHQMLVFCMTQAHAEHVSGVLNAFVGERFSDWIGVGRLATANDSILRKFQTNELPCLVQVDKASEGFNNQRASVGVFLNILRKNTVKQHQQGGRCLRRNYGIKNFAEDFADLFASPDTEAAEYIKELADLTLGDVLPTDRDRPPDGSEGGTDLWPIPPFAPSVKDATYDWSEIYRRAEEESESAQQALLEKSGKFASKEEVIEALRAIYTEDQKKMAAAAEAQEKQITLKKVEEAVRILADNAAQLTLGGRNNAAFKPLRGNYCKLISRRWIKHLGGKSALEAVYEDAVAKYEWVQAVNAELRRTRVVPEWLS